jgi:hypothetical protein
MGSDGLIAGAPSAAGTYTVTVSATDGFGLIGTAVFAWMVVALPQLTSPGNQTTVRGATVTLPIVHSGGIAPLAWSVGKPGAWGPTGLPPGLSIDPAAGTISGTPTAVGPAGALTVTVTDSVGKVASTTFAWTVTSDLKITAPIGARTDPNGTTVSLQAMATGGTAPYTWTQTGVPNPASISGTGLISGKVNKPGPSTVTLTVTDSTGQTATTTFVWTVS